MGKPPTIQEDFESPNIDQEADLAKNGAPKAATKAVYIVMAIFFVVLFLLVMVGMHIPTGG